MAEFDFKTLVIDKSYEVPVLVDFWAPWCGPCRVLGPVVEELAAEADGQWELVKVNTQEEQRLAMDYGIQSIPNVKLFFRGEIIGEFMGALPKYKIEEWLANHLPNPTKIAFQEIVEALENDPVFLSKLEGFVAENPDYTEAKLLLAKYKVFAEPEAAVELISEIRPGNPRYESAEDLRLLARLATFESDDDSQVATKLKASREAVIAEDWDAALNYLIEGLMINKMYQDEFPRRASIAVFRYLGEQHELTKKYRPRFSMALY
jgi:putative thioredoxin